MDTQESLYSLARYQGPAKWCFAIATNRAHDNLEQRPRLFAEALLRYEKATRRDWFDEETRLLIEQAEVKSRLWSIRCYFSHYSHADTCLDFDSDDEIRKIMEKAYEKAIFEERKRLTGTIEIAMPDLFESTGRITAAGVVFFCSFFVERRILNRLMGYVVGFRKTQGEFGFTRRVFAKYCLRDSHSIQAADDSAVMFRDIVGYLSRVPSRYYHHNKQGCDTEKHPERTTDKFIDLALRYLDTFAFAGLRNYTASFGRKQIVREDRQHEATQESPYKPYPPKARVRVVFGQENQGLAHHISHNTAILRIAKKDGRVHQCKIGVNELKYLVILCLQGKAEDAVGAIDDYCQRIQARFADRSAKVKATENPQFLRMLPEFVRVASRIDARDTERERTARIEYIKAKWGKKKAESVTAELHRKARDIIRYVNWKCARPLSAQAYNRLLVLLVNKDLRPFAEELGELKRREQVSEDVRKSLGGTDNLNRLHERVCDLVLADLDSLSKHAGQELDAHIGLIPRERKEGPSYEQKVQAFAQKPMICRGFLRERFFKGEGKTFAKLAEAARIGAGYPDVPLGRGYYHVSTLPRYDKDNSVLYETLARDRLCVMMGRTCYERLNSELKAKAQSVSWEKVGDKETICLSFHDDQEPGKAFQIRFGILDYAKLYVMENLEFLGGLMGHFFPQVRSVDYHRLYSDGIHRYTAMQVDGIEPILRFEERIISAKLISPSPEEYIRFRTVLDNSGLAPDDKEVLAKIRRNLLHYRLEFDRKDWRRFLEIMRNEGIAREKGQKGNRR